MNKRATSRRKAERVHRSSGNVFRDLGFPDADQRLAKAELAHQICVLIRAEGLSQSEAAAQLGIDQPKISALMRGRLKDFSTERLMRFITAFNRDVVITISDPKDKRRPSVRVLSVA
jgi:predicted XRE-type DNA-binding protein